MFHVQPRTNAVSTPGLFHRLPSQTPIHPSRLRPRSQNSKPNSLPPEPSTKSRSRIAATSTPSPVSHVRGVGASVDSDPLPSRLLHRRSSRDRAPSRRRDRRAITSAQMPRLCSSRPALERLQRSCHHRLDLPVKKPKAQVNYRAVKAGHNCATCASMKSDGTCAKVQGIVDRKHVCDLWSKKQ